MFFGQLAGHGSLRGIEAGLASQSNYLYHLDVKLVHRSTLAYANQHRPPELFKKMFFQNDWAKFRTTKGAAKLHDKLTTLL